MFTTFTQKAAPIALATVMAFGAIGTSAAEAGQRERVRNAGIIGAALGIAGAAAVIGSRRRAARPVYIEERPVYIQRRVRRAPRRVIRRARGGHVARCYAAYRSYDAASDTYVSYSGQVRRCLK